MQGEGVEHEIDVLAIKGNSAFVIEAKYRNDYRSKTHVNTVMYADARIEDIRRQAKKNGDTKEYYMWVITNTRFTDAAINYVQYRDVQIMGWDFPRYINLMKIVSEKKMFPVTILDSLNKKALNAFAKDGIVLVSQLANMTKEHFENYYELAPRTAEKLAGEVSELLR